jgi:hypothetical protein
LEERPDRKHAAKLGGEDANHGEQAYMLDDAARFIESLRQTKRDDANDEGQRYCVDTPSNGEECKERALVEGARGRTGHGGHLLDQRFDD